jgi:hypothetical protein
MPHRLIDPDHGHRLKQSRRFKWPGIEDFKSEVFDKPCHSPLCFGAVAGDELDRPGRIARGGLMPMIRKYWAASL